MRRATSAQAAVRWRGDEIRDVVEGDDEALVASRRWGLGYAYIEAALAVLALQVDLRPRPSAGTRGDEQAHDVGHDLAEAAADDLLLLEAEQAQGRTVDDGHDTLAIGAYDTGGDAGKHGLGEPAAFVELAVGFHEFVALALQLAGHAV